jgi:hypothetical protein
LSGTHVMLRTWVNCTVRVSPPHNSQEYTVINKYVNYPRNPHSLP